MPILKALLLDLYDTLALADWQLIAPGRAALAARAGVDPEVLEGQWVATHDARMRGKHGRLDGDLRVMLSACGLSPSEEAVAELAAMEIATWVAGVTLYADTLPVLARLRADGYRLAIVSNVSDEAGAVIAPRGLATAVDTVVLSCDVGFIKPENGIFQAALDRLGLGAPEAMLVDDVPLNLDAARAMGMHTALMVRGDKTPEASGHPVVRDLEELGRYLAISAFRPDTLDR